MRLLMFNDDRLEHFSQVMTLEPGDLIAAGTPDGVGPIAPAEEIELSISGLGRLRISVAARSVAAGA